MYFDDVERGLQADTEFVYDLLLPQSFEPQAEDGEVEAFSLLSVDQVKENLCKNMFTTDSSMVFIDFMVRHSMIDSREPGYAELITLLHRRLPFAPPSW